MNWCDFYRPVPGHENRPGGCSGEFRVCNHCGKKVCPVHTGRDVHVIYGCKCKLCGKTIVEGCEHGRPSWDKSTPVHI